MTGVPKATSRPGSSPKKRVPRMKVKMGCTELEGGCPRCTNELDGDVQEHES